IFGAAGLCVAFGLAARADVANPSSTYKSAFKIAQVREPASAKPAPATTQAPVKRLEPEATPVPEQFVSQAPAPVVSRRSSGSAVSRIVFGAEAKYREIEAFFGRVA